MCPLVCGGIAKHSLVTRCGEWRTQPDVLNGPHEKSTVPTESLYIGEMTWKYPSAIDSRIRCANGVGAVKVFTYAIIHNRHIHERAGLDYRMAKAVVMQITMSCSLLYGSCNWIQHVVVIRLMKLPTCER